MPLISLVRDTDAKIKTAPFSDGQVAVAYNSGNIYFDIQHLEDETNVQERVVVTNNKIFTGTSAEWLALSAADKAKYEIVNITDDDEEDGEIKLYNTTGQNTDGAMTQKAVTDALAAIQAQIDYIMENYTGG